MSLTEVIEKVGYVIYVSKKSVIFDVVITTDLEIFNKRRIFVL